MDQTGTFSDVHLAHNRNLKFSGTNNDGEVLNNSNFQVSSTNSTLNLKDNSNGKVECSISNLSLLHCNNISFFGKEVKAVLNDNSNTKVQAENSNLSLYKCQNFSLFGSGLKATLKDISNAKFQGDGNEVEATRNSNIKVTATGSFLKLRDNTNLSIDTEKSNVTAERNQNLTVSGAGGTTKVIDTQNHQLRKIRSLEDAVHKFEISPSNKTNSEGGFGSWISNTFSSSLINIGGNRCNDIKFIVDYVDEAGIEGPNYKLGVFDFTVNRRKLGSYEVKLGNLGMDPGSFKTKRVSPKEVIVQASKGGRIQSLKLCGPVVTQIDGSAVSFDINTGPPNLNGSNI